MKYKHSSFHYFLYWTQWSVSENNVRFLWWNSILTLKKIKKKGSSIFSWFLLFQLSVHIRNNSGQTSRPDPALHKWCQILFEITFTVRRWNSTSFYQSLNKTRWTKVISYFATSSIFFRLIYLIRFFVLNNMIFGFGFKIINS